MVPSAFVVARALPLTPNGKVDRNGPAGARARSARRSRPRSSPPRDPIEEALARDLGRGARRSTRSARHDSFFDLGGHSLLATQVIVAAPRRASASSCRCARCSRPRPSPASRVRIEDGRGPTAGLGRCRRSRPTPREGRSRSRSPRSALVPRPARARPGDLQHRRSPVRVRGPLDSGRLERSLAEIVRRHEALRTTLRRRRRPAASRSIAPERRRCRCARSTSGRSTEPSARRRPGGWRSEEARRPFDLARGPLVRRPGPAARRRTTTCSS